MSAERRNAGPRTIAIASGKGGVGKTNVVANVAVALQRAGRRVIVIDADVGLANIDTLLGLHPRATLRHVLRGECDILDVVIEGPAGVQVVPAASGFEDLTRLTYAERQRFLDQLGSLENVFDVLLLDTGAGISANVLFFVLAAQETMIVLTPEPTALTDAYALVKVLSTQYAANGFDVVVNMARSEWEARKTFARLSRVAERFLRVTLRYLGHLPYDAEVGQAVRRQRTLFELAPTAPATRAFEALAARVMALPEAPRAPGGLQCLFERPLVGERG